MEDFNISWMDETVERVRRHNWIYKLLCLALFRPFKKLKYKELYLILRGINESHLGEKQADAFALAEVAEVYKFNHNKLPKCKKE